MATIDGENLKDIENLEDVNEEVKLRAGFEINGRRPIYVFLRNPKNVRNLNKYGDVVYISSKDNFACLYVDEGGVEKLLPDLKRLPFVKYVKRGRLAELSEDFSAAFQETNREVSAEMKASQSPNSFSVGN